MGGGILNGFILGLVVSGVVLGAVSLSTPLPDRGEAPSPAPMPVGPLTLVPAVPEDAAPDADDAPTSPVVVLPGAMPEAAAEEPAATRPPATAPEAVAAPEPQADVAPDPAAAPPAEAEQPMATALPRPAADPAPRLPRADTPPMASAPVPPAPAPPEDAAPDADDAPDAPQAAIATPPVSPAPAEVASAPSPRFSTTVDASAGGTPPRRLTAPEPQVAPDLGDAADPPPEPAAARTDDPAPAPDQPRRLPQVPPATGVAPAAPALPQASAAPVTPPPAPPADLAPQPGPEPETTAPNALRDNAEAFSAPPGTPLMAVVLIDDPATPLDPVALADVSFPITFAIDPTRPDAAERAAAFRASGFEVVILAAPAIAPGATPADVEVALADATAQMPQAVAMMDDPSGRIQSDRPVLDATMGALGATGHGFIAFPQGLNAAEQTARRLGVPGTTFFRLLDDEDQRATVITRFLGRAAFDAVQTGSVIVAGRTRPDTVTALFSWALASRAEGVALAPVSAVLTNLPE
ncbi:divergent polysaccharide deacetylase family protein [Roseicyclus marinus]|uniref:divergent polysaccharide deacetylase family protein n=1 Tax=Roseicyclus marinus TaxID=2161673 RepID=UPI0036158A1C